MGDSFLIAPGDEDWRAKRKACAHAFYKERMISMLKTLQATTMAAHNRWFSAAANSADKSTDIDIAYEFERIFSRNIITVSFGEDISDEKFEI